MTRPRRGVAHPRVASLVVLLQQYKKWWAVNTFRFELVELDDGRCRLRFDQFYAVELSDDDFGVYNVNWGYYLESLRLLCTTGTGKPFHPGA